MSLKKNFLPLIIGTLSFMAPAAGAFPVASFAGAGIYHGGGYTHGGCYRYDNGCYRRDFAYRNNFSGDACNYFRSGSLVCTNAIAVPGTNYDCNGWTCAKTNCATDCVWF